MDTEPIKINVSRKTIIPPLKKNSTENINTETVIKENNPETTEPNQSPNSFREMINKKKEYGETPYRFYIVVAYFLLSFGNGFQWVTFSSCAENFGEAYKMPSWKVNMFSLIYMILYPFLCLPEGYLVDNYSTRLALILSSVSTLLGAGLKLFINTSMALVFVGQIFASLFQPAILNSPGKIAANWFRVNARSLVTAICCVANALGVLFGFIFHLFIIDDNVDPKKDPEKYKDMFFDYIFWEFIVNLVCCIPTFFIFRNKPKIPPSPSQNEEKSLSLFQSVKNLMKNSKFIFLLISTFFVVGYYNVYGTILNSYLALYGISDNQASIVYGVASGVGIVASLFISSLVDKYKKFKLFLIILVLSGTLSQVLFTLLLELSLHHVWMNKYAISLVMYTIVNVLVISFYTIGMNYACEITYPVGESTNGGFMMSMSQISGIVGTFACDALINNYEDKQFGSNVLLIGFFIIGSIFMFFLDEKLARAEIDEGVKIMETETRKQSPS